jgi:hypothetical protein
MASKVPRDWTGANPKRIPDRIYIALPAGSPGGGAGSRVAQEYIAVMDDILDALDEHGVSKREQEEFLMIAYSLRGEILHV